MISYYEPINGDLKIAHCSNARCSWSSKYILDSANDVGFYSSIAVGNEDGLPLIAYHDYTNYDLNLIHCSNERCLPVKRVYWP